MLCSYNLNTQAADNNRVQKLWSPAERYKPVGFSRLLTCWFYCCCCCCSSGSSFCSSCCRSSCSSCCQSQTDSKPTGYMMFCVCFLFSHLAFENIDWASKAGWQMGSIGSFMSKFESSQMANPWFFQMFLTAWGSICFCSTTAHLELHLTRW